MDRLTLLAQARRCGLAVAADGNLLHIRGPRRHADLAHELLKRKAEILAPLGESDAFVAELIEMFDGEEVSAPDDDIAWASELWPKERRGACRCCGGTRRWRLGPGRPWVCPRCHPPTQPADELEWNDAEDVDAWLAVDRLRFTPAPTPVQRTGLLGWASVVLYGAWALDGIAVRRTLDGRLVLSYPARRGRDGRQHPYVLPVHDGVRRELERQVLRLVRDEGQVAP